MQKSKILILSLPHGAGHQKSAEALSEALHERRPDVAIQTADALDHCAPWFRFYYNAYEIPLRYWPGLWEWIERIQHRAESTGPLWLYRRGAKPLSRYIETLNPDIVIVSEVGMCELAAMIKRETGLPFRLVGVILMDFNRAWVQPEVDLYAIAPDDDSATQLEAAAVPAHKILACGLPIGRAFASLPNRAQVRRRLQLLSDVPLLLTLFGGTGFGNAPGILYALQRVKRDWQAVFIAGRNRQLESQIRRLCQGDPRMRVLGWVDNMHEWMTAADLLVSKPAGITLSEALACGLPLLAFDPLPGNERRICDWIERCQVGRWVKDSRELASTLDRLLASKQEWHLLRAQTLKMARPRAAFAAAEAILKLLEISASLRKG